MANYIIIIISLLSLSAHASSCCGGGANIPNIILGDHQWEAKINYANSAVTDEASADGKINKISAKNEVTETISLKGAYQLDSYYQFAFELPFKKRTVESLSKTTSESAVVDPSFQLTWEFLPELSYSLIKPRGFLFFKQLIPTGNSIYNYNDPLLSDSLSRGVYESTIGLVLNKVIYEYDLSYSIETHHGFGRTIDNKKVYPGFGYSTSLSFGQSFGKSTRVGSAFTYWHDSSVEIDGNKGEDKYYLAGTLNFSYMFTSSSILISVTDQTLFDVAKNTNLAKSVALEYKFFEDL